MLGFGRDRKDAKAKDEASELPVEQAADDTSSAQVVPPAGDQAPSKRLGEILIEEGFIGTAQLEEALAVQRERGGYIGQIMVEMGLVKQEAVVSCLVKQCKIPHLSLMDYEVSKDVLDLIPRAICLEHSLIPIDKLGRILTIAMVNPFDVEALDTIRKMCPELRIKPILCDWDHFRLVVARVYGEEANGEQQEFDAMSILGPKRAKSHDAGHPSATPALQPEAVEEALDSATSEILREAAEHPEPAQAPSAKRSDASSSMSRNEMSTLVRESIGGAMQEAMATLMVDRQSGSLSGSKPSAMSSNDMAAMIREGVSGAVQEAMAEMAVQLRARAGEGKSAMPSSDDFLEVIRRGIDDAVQDAVMQAVAHLRVSAPATASSAIEDLPDFVRSTVRQVLHEVEASNVAQAVRQDLEARDAQKSKQARHASVSTFDAVRRKAFSILNSGATPNEDDERVLAAMTSERLLDGFTFDTFFRGKNNAFTYKLSEAVAAHPGGKYNPFFLHGDVGLGKTHLINAIGNAIMARNPDARIGYVSSSRFATRLADAVREDAANAFRENYCHWDVLILDDIQFLGGRVEAQEEFFHIFNVLQHEERQIIIAGDKAPDRLGLLEQRLVSRFAGGMVTSLKAPEWETRVAILQHQLTTCTARIEAEVVALIAMRVPNDVRKMIGALRKVTAYGELTNEPVTCDLANEILSHLGFEEAA